MVEREAVAPLHTRKFRNLAAEYYKPDSLNFELTEIPETLERLHELTEQNYGIVVMPNHWGITELPAVIKWCYQNPDLRRSRLIVPYASHQFKRKHAIEGAFLATKLVRTATPGAEEYYVEFPEEKPANYDQLNAAYIRESAKLLGKGGTVIFSPQGGRQPFLPHRIKNGMLGPFLKGLQGEGLDLERLAFLPIGTGLRGVEDYERWKNTKFDDPHPQIVLNIGKIQTFEETELEGRLIRADIWARNELAKVVPPAYLAK